MDVSPRGRGKTEARGGEQGTGEKIAASSRDD